MSGMPLPQQSGRPGSSQDFLPRSRSGSQNGLQQARSRSIRSRSSSRGDVEMRGVDMKMEADGQEKLSQQDIFHADGRKNRRPTKLNKSADNPWKPPSSSQRHINVARNMQSTILQFPGYIADKSDIKVRNNSRDTGSDGNASLKPSAPNNGGNASLKPSRDKNDSTNSKIGHKSVLKSTVESTKTVAKTTARKSRANSKGSFEDSNDKDDKNELVEHAKTNHLPSGVGTAIELLGGKSKILDAIEKPPVNGQIQLYHKFSTDYLYQSPLCPGKKKRSNSILLARNKKTGKIRIVSHILNEINFANTLADFHYAPPKSLGYGTKLLVNSGTDVNSGTNASTDANANNGRNIRAHDASLTDDTKSGDALATPCSGPDRMPCSGPEMMVGNLLNPPAMYSRINHVQDYNFTENLMSSKGSASASLSRCVQFSTKNLISTNSTWIPICTIKSGDSEVPKEAPKGASVEDYFDRVAQTNSIREKILLEILIDLFEQRPMWVRPSLLCSIHAELKKRALTWKPVLWWLQRALQATSFYWENGRFRNVYCRYGYDPRKNPEDCKYQVIDFRDSTIRADATIVRPGVGETVGTSVPRKGSGHSIGIGGIGNGNTVQNSGTQYLDPYFVTAPVKRSQCYQLCDIRDDDVQAIIRDRVIVKKQFLTRKDIENIRERMKLKVALFRSKEETQLFLKDI